MSRGALIIGVGGLGCPAALALAKAGFKKLTLIDPDVVDVSNLHRQPLHSDADIGHPKVESAAKKLRVAFPRLRIETLHAAVRPHTAVALFRGHDVVIDATDGVATKFLLSDASVLSGIPLIHGGAVRLEGQAMAIRPDGPCLRCLFEAPPPPDAMPSCVEAGVLGPVPGVIGGLQAMLAIDLLEGKLPAGEADLLRFDARAFTLRRLRVKKAADCRACSPAARQVLSLEAREDTCAA